MDVIAEHEACSAWEQIGPCVYCADHNIRLYQGTVAEGHRATPVCADKAHDWDEEQGVGFYAICRTCQTIEWYE